jgi:hypothetical protein
MTNWWGEAPVKKVKAYTPVTKDELRSYLKTHPNQKHECGNSSACVLANVLLDKFPDSHVTVGFGETTINTDGQRVEYRQRRWQKALIRRFDDMRHTDRKGRTRRAFTSKYLLGRLDKLLAYSRYDHHD